MHICNLRGIFGIVKIIGICYNGKRGCMKKIFYLFLIVLLILCFWGCDASDTFIRIDYASKIDGGLDVFSITHIKAADKEGERVKIKRTDFDEFDEMIRQSDNFFGMDKVY